MSFSSSGISTDRASPGRRIAPWAAGATAAPESRPEPRPEPALPRLLTIGAPDAVVPRAWRTLWRQAGAESPPILLDLRPGRANLWAARLDAAVAGAEGPVVIAAHGIGCLALAWWARLSPAAYVAPVAAGLMLDPVAGDDAALPDAARRFAAGPRTLLPFPSLVAQGARRGRAINARLRALASGWGGRFLEAIGDETALAESAGARVSAAWREGERMLHALVARLGEPPPRRGASPDAPTRGMTPDAGRQPPPTVR